MSDPARYTVGWICALSVEYVAAQEFLDEHHDKPSWVSPNDENDYSLGNIGEHNVVIAVLPDGEYGTSSAAHVAANMLSTFHNVRIRLLVGIGGGVPSKRHDVRLGDVVVSASRGGEAAVFQNDFGKCIQDQDFQHTRFLDQPPSILRAAVTGIQTQYERKGHQLEEAITRKLNNNRRLRQNYGRPGAATDRLFKSDVVHGSNCGTVSCADDISNLVHRLERTEDEDNPTIHYGLIASSNQLMKDALVRDKLAAKKDVLCFEMEAAGVMNSFRCLVIRGICDYSDSHKNKEWQGYAAMVAAAYAKDILQRIPINKIEAEQRIQFASTGINLPQSTNQRSNQDHDLREQRQEEQTERARAEEQKDNNPCRAEAAGQRSLQSPEDPRVLSLSALEIREDEARASSEYQEPIDMLNAPAAEKNVLQHHQSRFKPIVGVSLNDLYERDRVTPPLFLSRCFSAVEKFGLDRKELYQNTGSASDVNRIKSAFEAGVPEVKWNNPNNLLRDVSSITGLVKLFLWELPEPLFTFQHYRLFIDAARIDDDIKRRDSLHALIHMLPDAHLAVARNLFLHLDEVQKHSAQNHMQIGDLALCFTPILMGGNPEFQFIDAGWHHRIIITILENVSQIFR
ncbi:unnamed protein product [Penicillium bialowiezense]